MGRLRWDACRACSALTALLKTPTMPSFVIKGTCFKDVQTTPTLNTYGRIKTLYSEYKDPNADIQALHVFSRVRNRRQWTHRYGYRCRFQT